MLIRTTKTVATSLDGIAYSATGHKRQLEGSRLHSDFHPLLENYFEAWLAGAISAWDY